METFADVLHAIIDTVFTGDAAEKAHGIIDNASGTRSESAQAATEQETPAEATTDSPVPGADEEAPPTPGG